MKKKLSSTLIKLVTILNDGQYHDGTRIGELLKMTRSAVWKSIKKLEGYDVQIDSMKGKGYALLEPLILLDKNKIKQNLNNKKITVDVFESLNSTNDYLQSVKDGEQIKICLAEQQTQGKGRLNREWHSPFAKNIYLSCYFPFRKDISEMAGLSLITSLATISVLKTYGIKENLFVKWPNDIIYANKKLSGSLVEIQGETNGISHAVIGIGLNVNMLNDANHSISQPWTSVRKILNSLDTADKPRYDGYVDRNQLASALINNLIAYLYKFAIYGFALFAEEWLQADCLANQMVYLKNINEKVQAKVTGINEQGHLIVQLPNGSIRTFSSGDTSIIKKFS